ncbi:MAG: hypothetical protein WBL95_15315 [Microcoleus sp.]
MVNRDEILNRALALSLPEFPEKVQLFKRIAIAKSQTQRRSLRL